MIRFNTLKLAITAAWCTRRTPGIPQGEVQPRQVLGQTTMIRLQVWLRDLRKALWTNRPLLLRIKGLIPTTSRLTRSILHTICRCRQLNLSLRKVWKSNYMSLMMPMSGKLCTTKQWKIWYHTAISNLAMAPMGVNVAPTSCTKSIREALDTQR